jgi:hypothetical protein
LGGIGFRETDLRPVFSRTGAPFLLTAATAFLAVAFVAFLAGALAAAACFGLGRADFAVLARVFAADLGDEIREAEREPDRLTLFAIGLLI